MGDTKDTGDAKNVGAPSECSVVKSLEIQETIDDSRRETLKRLGRYGAYSAPAMIALLTAKKAAAIIT